MMNYSADDDPRDKHAPLSWHDVSHQLASIAERSHFHIRPKPGGWKGWQVWATDKALTGLKSQLDPPSPPWRTVADNLSKGACLDPWEVAPATARPI